jgi:hypothetical protein
VETLKVQNVPLQLRGGDPATVEASRSSRERFYLIERRIRAFIAGAANLTLAYHDRHVSGNNVLQHATPEGAGSAGMPSDLKGYLQLMGRLNRG